MFQSNSQTKSTSQASIRQSSRRKNEGKYNRLDSIHKNEAKDEKSNSRSGNMYPNQPSQFASLQYDSIQSSQEVPLDDLRTTDTVPPRTPTSKTHSYHKSSRHNQYSSSQRSGRVESIFKDSFQSKSYLPGNLGRVAPSSVGLETIRDTSNMDSSEVDSLENSPVVLKELSGLDSLLTKGYQNFPSMYGSVVQSVDPYVEGRMHSYTSSQQEQIRSFSDMVQQSSLDTHGTSSPSLTAERKTPKNFLLRPVTDLRIKVDSNKRESFSSSEGSYYSSGVSSDNDDEQTIVRALEPTCMEMFLHFFDITRYLMSDAKYSDNGVAYFDDDQYTIPSFFRYFFYNPISPEFTSIQQFLWAIIIGIIMGFYTAAWKWYIERGVQFWWVEAPDFLFRKGFFTEIDGKFPLYHYMWMLPSFFGGLLSYLFAAMTTKIPTQDQWISNVHSRGVQDHTTFFPLFFLSTAAMWSGLSLGPELPLVLTAGMAGSWLAIITKQSVLQARVLNLTAASAAVGGFFGFPMAGALFVLEIPHRLGLQYFEALSPGTISSIVAVLTNRLVTGNDVTGYFSYPFLTATLPSTIFTDAIFYGFYGCIIGIIYGRSVKAIKNGVHHWFSAPHHKNHTSEKNSNIRIELGEEHPLLLNKTPVRVEPRVSRFVIRDPATRAAAAGIIVGAVVGFVGMFIPHTLFWSEAQLQNLIDRGRTPLPIFGEMIDGPTNAFTTFSMCLVDSTDPMASKVGFGIECSFLIVVSKIIVIGLSLGTGIIGGHFWGPLYVGCAAGHLLTDACTWFESQFGFGGGLATYPCVVILCTMGSSHVVTFRAHMAIMLILTLTITAFSSEDDPASSVKFAGDYSAVFPLLVISVFISLMASRDTVFYSAQRNRGDIIAIPEVLCQPGKAGDPVVIRYKNSDEDSVSDNKSLDDSSTSDVENRFDTNGVDVNSTGNQSAANPIHAQNSAMYEVAVGRQKLFDPSIDGGHNRQLSSDRLDELLLHAVENRPSIDNGNDQNHHRRSQSLPVVSKPSTKVKSNSSVRRTELPSPRGNRDRCNSKGSLVRVPSFGNIEEHQPSLLEQARISASPVAGESKHRRMPSAQSSTGLTQHRRIGSSASAASNLGESIGRGHNRIPSRGMHSRKHSDSSPKGFSFNVPSGIDTSLSTADFEGSFRDIGKKSNLHSPVT